MPRIVTVVGTRPQFIKAAPVTLAFQEAGITEISIHTGQHYDPNMSAIFYDQLQLPRPHYHLHIGSGSHGHQTGEGLKQIESILQKEEPDAVLVYGDTNATIAGALAAVKLHIPVAHVEAGLRSFNRRMPEEINRVMTDHISTWLFTPTVTANDQLAKEGITEGVEWVGDVMLDAVELFSQVAEQNLDDFLSRYNLQSKQYRLLTMHRAETTEQPEQVRAILETLEAYKTPILFPVHPRVRPIVESLGRFDHIKLVDPIGYFDMLLAERHAELIITDSGGVQKEAVFADVPCITMRTETEWVETVENGWNQIVGLDPKRLEQAIETAHQLDKKPIKAIYGSGQARLAIAKRLASALNASSKADKTLATV